MKINDMQTNCMQQAFKSKAAQGLTESFIVTAAEDTSHCDRSSERQVHKHVLHLQLDTPQYPLFEHRIHPTHILPFHITSS